LFPTIVCLCARVTSQYSCTKFRPNAGHEEIKKLGCQPFAGSGSANAGAARRYVRGGFSGPLPRRVIGVRLNATKHLISGQFHSVANLLRLQHRGFCHLQGFCGQVAAVPKHHVRTATSRGAGGSSIDHTRLRMLGRAPN